MCIYVPCNDIISKWHSTNACTYLSSLSMLDIEPDNFSLRQPLL